MAEAVVRTGTEAARLEHGAAIVLESLREFLDAADLGRGDLEVSAIGDGHSNLSFLVGRGERRFVLRRPPRGEIAASANDVLREARVLAALEATPVPVPEVLATCEETEVIGAPFFVMSYVAGMPINDGLGEALDVPDGAEKIAADLLGALVDLHASDLEATGLNAFGRPSGYLERQVRRFGSLLEANATRPLPDLELLAEWLGENLPPSEETTFIHGDYRLGNLMFAPPLHLSGVLDWEMATVGDPLADVGYLTATWAEPGEEMNPMLSLSRLTTRGDFPSRAGLATRYAEASGRSVERLRWYQVLALWKSAIFLEGSFRRFKSGASSDPFFATLEQGVPALGASALRKVRTFEAGG